MSKAALATVTIFVCLTIPKLHSQDFPRVELFGGYSYLSFDTSGVRTALDTTAITSRMSLSGWATSANINVNRWIGFEGDVRGHYHGNCEGVSFLNCSDLSLLGGPQVSFRKGPIAVFGHGLFGAHKFDLSASTSSLSSALTAAGITVNKTSGISVAASEVRFGIMAGGGVDYSLGRHASIRLVQFDYFSTHHFDEFSIPRQNNYEISAGIVFTLGGSHQGNTNRKPSSRIDTNQSAPQPVTRPTPQRTLTTEPPGATSEAALFGISGYAVENGFTITSIRAGSPPR